MPLPVTGTLGRRRTALEAAELLAGGGAAEKRLGAGADRARTGDAGGVAVQHDARPALVRRRRRRREHRGDELVDAVEHAGEDAADVLEDTPHVLRGSLAVLSSREVAAAPAATNVVGEPPDVLFQAGGEPARVARHAAR